MMNRCVRVLVLALSVLLPLGGCTSPGADLPPLPPAPPATAYRLGPGDTLNIQVLGANELNGTYQVQADGTIRMLMIGKVQATGLTPAALATRVSDELKGGRYITRPYVSVSVSTYRPFYILGEVSKPGAYPYASGMRVLGAVADAQGYTYRADQDYVIVTRNGKTSRASTLSEIEPDDIIRVPERYL